MILKLGASDVQHKQNPIYAALPSSYAYLVLAPVCLFEEAIFHFKLLFPRNCLLIARNSQSYGPVTDRSPFQQLLLRTSLLTTHILCFSMLARMGILQTKEVDIEYLKRASKSVHITAVFVVMVSMKYEISCLGKLSF